MDMDWRDWLLSIIVVAIFLVAWRGLPVKWDELRWKMRRREQFEEWRKKLP